MTPFDILRFVGAACFGIGAGLLVFTNVIAFKVLRIPHRLGFLWWHITGISITFLCYGSVCMYYLWHNLGHEPSWRSWSTLTGSVCFAFSMTIVYTVERKRLAFHTALVDPDGPNVG